MRSLTRRLTDAMDENWPSDATIYMQDEQNEIVLPDFASCLSTQTLLEICGLSYRVDRVRNAEYMSAHGRVPFMSYGGNKGLCGFNEILEFINEKDRGVDSHLTTEQLSDLLAYKTTTERILETAELYLAWKDVECSDVTKVRYGFRYPWPLNYILPKLKQRDIMKTLHLRGWENYSEKEVCEKVRQCCQVLSLKLSNQKYFFGDKATSLDACVFGHLFAILTTPLPNSSLLNVIKDFTNLERFLVNINTTYFNQQLTSPQ